MSETLDDSFAAHLRALRGGDYQPAAPEGGSPQMEPETAATRAAPPAMPEEQDGGLLSRAWRTVRDIPSNIATAVVGEPTQYALPEFTQRTQLNPKLGREEVTASLNAYLRTNEVEDTAKRLHESLPGSKLEHDDQGRPIIITADNKPYYVNKPGLTQADLLRATPEIALSLIPSAGIARVGYLAGRGAIRTGMRALAQGAGQAGVAAGYDQLAGEGAEMGRTIAAGAGGVVGEPVAIGLQAAGRAAANLTGKAYRNLTGGVFRGSSGLAGDAPLMPADLSPAAQRLITLATGQDINDALVGTTVQMARRLDAQLPGATLLRASRNPEEARRVWYSASTGIPFDAAQLTGNRQLGAELDQIRNMPRRNPVASDVLTNFRQQTQMGGLTSEQNRLTTWDPTAPAPLPGSPARPTLAPGEGPAGLAVARDVGRQADALRADATTAWNAPGLTHLTPQGMRDPANRANWVWYNPSAAWELRQVIGQVRGTTSTSNIAREETNNAVNRVMQMIATRQGYRPFNLGDVDVLRQDLRVFYQRAREAGNEADARGVNELQRGLDRVWRDPALLDATRSNPAVVQNYSDALEATARKNEMLRPERFDQRYAADFMKLQGQADISGRATVNRLFAESGIEGIGTLQTIRHLRANGVPVENMKTALKQRVLFGGEPEKIAMQSPGNIRNRIDMEIFGSGNEVARELLSPGELAQFRRLREALNIMTESNPLNPSKSGYTVGELAAAATPIGLVRKLIEDVLRPARLAARATTGQMPTTQLRLPSTPIGTARAAAPASGGLLSQGRQGLLGQPDQEDPYNRYYR